MGLIKVIEQGANSETAGLPKLIVSEKLSVLNGVVYVGSTMITYTSTASSIPSDKSLFDSWLPVVGAMYGASGPSINAPTILDGAKGIIYPSVM